MSSLPGKPGLRHSLSEWSSNNQQLSAAAAHERLVSTAIRQEGRSLRSHTHSQTVWDEGDTSRRLADRVGDVSRWKQALEICAQKVDEEMEALTLCKEQSEQALAATALPLEVSAECLALREGRRGLELVVDGTHTSGHLDTWTPDIRHQLTSDLQNKMEALDVDRTCLTLTVQSASISLKSNPTRIPAGSSTPQEWLQFSQVNVSRGHDAVQTSQQLREDMSLTRAQLQNELETQHRATEFDLRKRTHQEEQARDQLQWQIRATEDEMLEMEKDIQGLDSDLLAKTASLKLAHTRLENRTGRSGVDLCRDQVQHGLMGEVQQLEASIAALKQKLSQAQLSLQKMKLHHSLMLQDLSRKQEALSLEQRSMNTRLRLTSAPSGGAATEKTSVLMVPLTNSSGRSHLQLLAQ
uniref:Tektin n=1 Tax=Salarias fasciatus TaxID=181472 RepID=A0A672HKP7_SALFA